MLTAPLSTSSATGGKDMKESELERRFCRLVEQAGGKAYKFVSPGNSGVPDRVPRTVQRPDPFLFCAEYRLYL